MIFFSHSKFLIQVNSISEIENFSMLGFFFVSFSPSPTIPVISRKEKKEREREGVMT